MAELKPTSALPPTASTATSTTTDATTPASASADAEKLRDKLLTSSSDAQRIASSALQRAISLCVSGASIGPICKEIDSLLSDQTEKLYKKSKNGIAFPCCVSVNNQAGNVSPLESDDEFGAQLKAGDLVKIQLGAHIAGFGSVVSESVIVPPLSSSSSDNDEGGIAAKISKAARVLNCTNVAAEAVIRSIRPGIPNSKISDLIQKIGRDYGCVALSGQVSSSTVQNKFSTAKRISLTASSESPNVEEGDVWIFDLLMSTSPDGKCAKGETRTCVFNKTGTVYQLKSAVARKAFSQLAEGEWPFVLRGLEDEKKGRFAMSECERSGVVNPFEVLYDKPSELVAQNTFTVYIGKTHNTRLSPAPSWINTPEAKEMIASAVVPISDAAIAELVKQPLKPSKKKATKPAAGEEAASAPAS